MADEQMKVRFVGDASSLETASKQSTAALDNVTKSTAKVSQSLQQASAQMARSSATMGGAIKKGSGEATQSLINLSRVAQDAPYGFIGIANNLNPLLESFQRLKASSGTTGAALKALGSELLGAGGIGLAVGVVSSLMVVFGDKIFGASKKAEEAKTPIQQLKKAYEDLRDTSSSDILGKAGSDFTKAITAIESLRENVKLAKQGFIDKKEVIAQYNKELGDTIGKVQTLDEVEKAIASKGNAYLQFTLLKAAAQQALQKASDAALLAAQNTAKADVIGDNPLLGGIQKALKAIKTGGDANQSLDAFNKNIEKFSSKFKVQADEANHQKDRFIDIFKQFQDQAAKIAKDNGFKFEPDIKPGGKEEKNKFGFLFDFLPFDPNGKLKPEQRAELINAADKFSKEFSGILKGVLFTGDADSRIAQAKQFDLKLKAGNIQFDTKSFQDAMNKGLKPEDIIPESKLTEIDNTIVDKFIRGMQDASETLQRKNINLFGNLFAAQSPQDALKELKGKLLAIGEQLPQTFEATNIFGQKVTVTLDQLLDFTKVSPNEAIKVLQNTFGAVISELDNQKNAMNTAFAGFSDAAFSDIGEGVGKAIANGASAIQVAANSIGEAIGSLVEQIGKALVKYGIVKMGLDQVLKAGFALPGAAAIAIGIGAIAIGALIKASFANVKKFAAGGLAFGPTMGLVGEGIGTSRSNPEVIAPLDKLKDFISPRADFPQYLPAFSMSHDQFRLWYQRANKYGNTFGK